MQKHHHIVIAGAGGIAEAAALLLIEWSDVPPTLYIGDRHFEKAQNVARWLREGATKPCYVHPFHLPEEGLEEELVAILRQGEILLDCLPGSLAPKMATWAKTYHLHYANLTEYVAETNQILDLAADADTGFVLQTGLAPGYINVLANGLFQQFCRDFGVDQVDKLEMKVGALTDYAQAPHFYGFTWSTVGVATEYLKDTLVVRDFRKMALPALSEKGTIIIDGVTYEDNLTSGGAADLPDALLGKVRALDYKTLRYPGHYDWVRAQIAGLQHAPDLVAALQHRMEAEVPHVEDDRIVLYAAVEGLDAHGLCRRREVARLIRPMQVGKHQLRAIQTTTAVPMLQCAQLLLETPHRGVMLQSQIDPVAFLNGRFVVPVYGAVLLA